MIRGDHHPSLSQVAALTLKGRLGVLTLMKVPHSLPLTCLFVTWSQKGKGKVPVATHLPTSSGHRRGRELKKCDKKRGVSVAGWQDTLDAK